MFTNNQLVSAANLIHLFGNKMIVSNYSCLFVNIRVIRGYSPFF